MEEETTLLGLKKVSIKTDYQPEEHSTKRVLSITTEVTEEQANTILTLEKTTGSWYMVLGVEAAQLPLEVEALAGGTTKESPL